MRSVCRTSRIGDIFLALCATLLSAGPAAGGHVGVAIQNWAWDQEGTTTVTGGDGFYSAYLSQSGRSSSNGSPYSALTTASVNMNESLESSPFGIGAAIYSYNAENWVYQGRLLKATGTWLDDVTISSNDGSSISGTTLRFYYNIDGIFTLGGGAAYGGISTGIYTNDLPTQGNVYTIESNLLGEVTQFNNFPVLQITPESDHWRLIASSYFDLTFTAGSFQPGNVLTESFSFSFGAFGNSGYGGRVLMDFLHTAQLTDITLSDGRTLEEADITLTFNSLNSLPPQSTVPEPSTFVLCGLGAMAFGLNRLGHSWALLARR